MKLITIVLKLFLVALAGYVMYYSRISFFLASFGHTSAAEINGIAAVIFGVIGSWYVLFGGRPIDGAVANNVKYSTIMISTVFALMLTWPIAMHSLSWIGLATMGGPKSIELLIRSLAFLPFITLFVGVVTFRISMAIWVRRSEGFIVKSMSRSLLTGVVVVMLAIVLIMPIIFVIIPRFGTAIIESLVSRR